MILKNSHYLALHAGETDVAFFSGEAKDVGFRGAGGRVGGGDGEEVADKVFQALKEDLAVDSDPEVHLEAVTEAKHY